ncbi:MAG TPA: VOC family protein [Acidimicrobiia bacterium]|nr:VOC family protein [Acidimicrobiia bacterium]
MKPLGLHHVNVPVRDLAEAIEFYTDVLGFTLAPRPDFGMDGAWFDMGGGQLHIGVNENAATVLNHFAIQVDDLDAIVEELRAKDIEVFTGNHFDGAGFQAFLQDPSGNVIELNQPDGVQL